MAPLAPEWLEFELVDSCDDECALFLNFSPNALIFGKRLTLANAELVDALTGLGRAALDGCAYKCDGSKFLLMGMLGRGDEI